MIPIRIRTSIIQALTFYVQVQGLGMVHNLLITRLGPYHVITNHTLYTPAPIFANKCKQQKKSKQHSKILANSQVGGRGAKVNFRPCHSAIDAPLYILVHAHEHEGTVTLTAVESCIMKSILSPRPVKVCLSTNRVSAIIQYAMQSCSFQCKSGWLKYDIINKERYC